MKLKLLPFLFSFLALLLVFQLSAAEQVASTTIEKSNINLRGAPVVLGTVEITVKEAGTFIVDFDGLCISSPGDEIRLAASADADWHVNDGGVTCQAYSSDINGNNFSHTRAFEVEPGTHTFYAVAENVGVMDGSGIASFYAKLVVQYIPESSEAFILHQGVNETNINLRGAPVSLSNFQFMPVTSFDGDMLVKFNGYGVGSPGDLIVLAASDRVGWDINDGNTAIEAINNDLKRIPFIHTRVFPASSGLNSFHAVGQNYVETEGTGFASVYASLSIMYIPDDKPLLLEHEGINETSINVRGTPVVLESITINPTTSGTAVVTFNGYCVSSVGDRIVLAASDNDSWGSNSGSTSVEAISADLNSSNFSHTMIYDIEAGSHTFNAIAHNYVETEGTGKASIYASLNVQFYPIDNVGFDNPQAKIDKLQIWPNPASGTMNVNLAGFDNQKASLRIVNYLGQQVYSSEVEGGDVFNMDVSNLPSGNYIMLLNGERSTSMNGKFTIM